MLMIQINEREAAIGLRKLKARPCLSASDTHMPRDGGFAVAAVDDEVVALGLAADSFVDGGNQKIIALRGAKRRTEVGGVLLA